MVDTSNIPVEAETTLLICSEHPRSTARAVADLSHIGAFRLVGERCHVLNDTYFDTQGSDLKHRHWILRLRGMDSTWWITLKGPSREASDGVMERSELEIPWSPDAFVQVMDKLDIPFASPAARNISSVDAVKVMREHGMVVVQHRVTERRVKNVLSSEQPVVIAEIAIDRVRYDFSGREILHHEIEIESRHDDYRSAVALITDELRERFAPELRVWKVGKLATGLIIDTLVRRNALDGIINEDGSLQPEAYDLVRLCLTGRP